MKAKLQTEQQQENKQFELQVPLGKKSLPTRFSRTELLPLLCKKQRLMLTIQKLMNPLCKEANISHLQLNDFYGFAAINKTMKLLTSLALSDTLI